MKVELSRFKIKKGKEEVADEWIKLLNDRVEEVVETMNREKIYVEAIFEEEINSEKYLTWFSVQDETGEMCMTSDHEIDKIHLKYWNDCIDDTVPADNQKLKLFLLNKGSRLKKEGSSRKKYGRKLSFLTLTSFQDF